LQEEVVMKTSARTGSETFETFCYKVREDQKADLLDGVIYMASPENTDANKLFFWLGTLLDLYVEEKDLGDVFGSRVAVRLDDTNAPEPDLLFVSKDREDQIERGGIRGPADLAIEIVSPDSVERDYTRKRRKYEEFGIREYWIIDEHEEKVTLLRLSSKGKYREVRPKGGILRSEVVPGFWIRISWLWQHPRPKKRAILEEILTGST
jgi:Uma2 family endonuclease